MEDEMAQLNAVTAYEVDDGIAVITTDNPPVNALGHAVREGLVAGIAAAMADAAVRAVVVSCKGRTFYAGADITEFGRPLKQPGLHEVIAAFEASPKPLVAPDLGDVVKTLDAATKPVVAGIFGTALGGGLEVALGCHYRVAVASARLGLPEVKLGLLPGAGGTQRLPRVVGPETAVVMITSAKRSEGLPMARMMTLPEPLL